MGLSRRREWSKRQVGAPPRAKEERGGIGAGYKQATPVEFAQCEEPDGDVAPDGAECSNAWLQGCRASCASTEFFTNANSLDNLLACPTERPSAQLLR